MDSSQLTPFIKIKKCIDENQNFVLQGGAGSGKTETLKQTLEFVSEHHPEKKIACITHTNLAASEIKSRAGDKYTISTIHSFLNTLTKDYKKNIKKVIPLIFKLEIFVRKDIVHYEDIKQQNKEEYLRYKKLYNKYASKLFTVTKDTVNKVEGKREYDKTPEQFNEILNKKIDELNIKISKHIEESEHSSIKYNETSFDNYKELTYGHDSLLEITYLLCMNYKYLGRIIQDKYDFIFIDEYQDTNKKIIDIFLKLLPSNKKTLIGLFGDSMQAIYEDGVGDVEEYINEGHLIKIEKQDNFRCSEQVVKFINRLRFDKLQQKVAFKVDTESNFERIENRQGSVKLYYGIYDNKPNVFSEADVKEDYMKALNMLIDEANKDQKDFRNLMLTNKSISVKAGFENLYDTFSRRYSDPKDTIDKHLQSLQLSELFDLCDAYELKNYNFVLSNIQKHGYSVRKMADKIKIKENFDQIIKSDKSAMETLKLAFESRILKCSDKFSEYVHRKDTFLNELKQNKEYLVFKHFYITGDNTYAKMSKVLSSLEEDEFKELEKKVLKETFYIELFSQKIKFTEIYNYFNYMNENTQFITMHKTKGSGIDNVLVVLDEYFWNVYDFKSIFSASLDDKKKHKSQKLIYVACSRAKVNLACVKLISSDEEEHILKYFEESVKVELKQEQVQV
ncbi:ATP-dependent helicase [Paenibacillus sp. SZ31]|uniref:UvrD-helicase domain-containing protein n=1 Tax=Paenibacillus sp. SZ31 TaxID=2725555 RepID=UPI00146E5953|nr:UvrD-helicase domain-containing protein [Paenibacillus sp. SZ31]NMI05794.1 ATP-dependent helicase [Paenibacillus sp. SZ31]